MFSVIDTFRSELDALKLFLSSQCSVDGAVAKELKDTVAKLEQKFSAESDNEVTLKIKTSGEDSTVVVLKIGLHSTAADLLAKVEVSATIIHLYNLNILYRMLWVIEVAIIRYGC